MCLSTVSLAVFILLDFKFSAVPGKVYSWDASDHSTKFGSRKKYICLGDLNIGVTLEMTSFGDKLKYRGVEQLSQVWFV